MLAMSSVEAAELLHVSVRQVERLVANGVLEGVGAIGRSLLIDPGSVYRLQRAGLRRGRRWSLETVISVLHLLSPDDGAVGNRADHARLIARVSRMTAEDVVRAMRPRARVERFSAHESVLEKISERVAITGTSVLSADFDLSRRFGLSPLVTPEVDGYATAAEAASMIRRYFLVPDPQGKVTLRIADWPIPTSPGTRTVLTALDLCDSLAVREREAGLIHIESRLVTLR